MRPLAEQRVGTVRSALLGEQFGCRFDLSNVRATSRTTLEILGRLRRVLGDVGGYSTIRERPIQSVTTNNRSHIELDSPAKNPARLLT